jgi:non-ribosomal peptide synthetase component E (peptide arylation enzyme)
MAMRDSDGPGWGMALVWVALGAIPGALLRWALANLLVAEGIGQGDRVGVLLPQMTETAAAHVAVFKLGGISIPLFTLFGAEALQHRLREIERRRDADTSAPSIDDPRGATTRADKVGRLLELARAAVSSRSAHGRDASAFGSKVLRCPSAHGSAPRRASNSATAGPSPPP